MQRRRLDGPAPLPARTTETNIRDGTMCVTALSVAECVAHCSASNCQYGWKLFTNSSLGM